MQLALTELLDYIDEERLRWRRWFADHPEALDLPLKGEHIPTVAALVRHLLGVQLFFAERLSGRKPAEWWKEPVPAREELFAFGGRAASEMRRLIAEAPPELWTTVFDIDGKGKFLASGRKAVAGSLIHAARHWAQVAAIVRQNGFAPPGGHDLILSSALE